MDGMPKGRADRDRLSGRHVLVVEDNYLIADDICRALQAAGAVVIGPTGHLADAIAIAGTAPIAAAVLDVALGESQVFRAAERLAERGIPFLFATGYQGWVLPAEYAAVPRIEKPFAPEAVLHAVRELLA